MYDKSGAVELAQALHSHGARVLASGGTAKALSDGPETYVRGDVVKPVFRRFNKDLA